MASRDRRRLLVNFVYCPPVGHVVEGLHYYCHGYTRANPQVTIAVAVLARHWRPGSQSAGLPLPSSTCRLFVMA